MGAEQVAGLNLRSGVDKLLFTVKLWLLISLQLMLLLTEGCGYRAAYGQPTPGDRLAVVPAPPLVGDIRVIESALAGAREELARSGRLGEGKGYPRLVVELVRLEEVAAGLTVDGKDARARGTSIAVVGRAWIERGPDATPERDTGDMQRVERYAPETDLRVEAYRHDQAGSAAARELGRALVQRVLGHPAPSVEPI